MPTRKLFKVIFISVLLLASRVYSQDKDKLVAWSGSERLSSSDFQLDAPEGEAEHSLGRGKRSILEGYIFTGIDFSFRQVGHKISYTVQSFMSPEKSWLRDHSDLQTLEHEQAHFDITEIYSRKMKRALSTVRNTDSAKRIYQQYFRDLQEEQKRFDAAHRGEAGVEPEWQEKISSSLAELDKWSDTDIEPD